MIICIVIYNIRTYENIKIMNIFILIISLFSILSAFSAIYCDICSEIIKEKYFEDAWGNRYHSSHNENAIFCDTCSRIVSTRITGGGFQFNDGRYMCKLCEASMVNTNKLKLESLNTVLELLSKKGINVKTNAIKINLVNRKTLQNSVMSLTKHDSETIKAVTIFDHHKYIINILWGLNQLEFESALAHELLHVWIDFNNIKLNVGKLEGFCNLGSSLVYSNYNSQLSKLLLNSMEKNNDPIYGRGYRYMNSLLQAHGWEELISILLKNNQN